jgi:hypothetical protein
MRIFRILGLITAGSLPVTAALAQESACIPPGITVYMDGTDDSLAPSPDPSLDIERLSVSEPTIDGTQDRIAFHLKMHGGGYPGGHIYRMSFKAADGVYYRVGMEVGAPGEYAFFYRVSGGEFTGDNVGGQTLGPRLDADPASSATGDGLISVVVPRTAIGSVPPGEISEFVARVSNGATVYDNAPPDTSDGTLERGGTPYMLGSCGGGEPGFTFGPGGALSPLALLALVIPALLVRRRPRTDSGEKPT